MRLLSLTIEGQYKGLRDQSFNFDQAQGNVVAFIGLNGSGKSQLLELIGEAFSYLERYKRRDFKVRGSLGFGVTLIYQINVENDPDILSYPDDFKTPANNEPTLRVSILLSGKVVVEAWLNGSWLEILIQNRCFPTPHLVGYSSGLNENLQRSFMKNAVQFYDVMRVRHNRRKDLSGNINETGIAMINRRYHSRYPHIFSVQNDDPNYEPDYLSLEESDTQIPKNIYLDYDSCALLMFAFSILDEDEIGQMLSVIRFKFPKLIRLKYDLRRGLASDDSVNDIRLLIRAAGAQNVEGIVKRTKPEVYEIYELDYLAGYITFDLSNSEVKGRLSDANYGDPLQLFERLYKMQMLGVANWQGETRKKLRLCGFIETVKKPLKAKLPLLVDRFELSDGSSLRVSFDDLSDGETQLIQILAVTRIFRGKEVLFLFDEPDTHLNPSWRTSFYSFLENIVPSDTNDVQFLISTHSPFMISSLKRTNVFQFRRNHDRLIEMSAAQNETYGASFEVLTKELFGLRSLISQSVIEEIRDQLKQGDHHAREWIENNLGLSAERAYLLKKLEQ